MYKTQSLGSRGPEAAILQALLNSKPPTSRQALSVDGIFGPKTLARVKKFQESSGLKADGVVGPLTWSKLLDSPSPRRHVLKYCDNTNRLHMTSSGAEVLDFKPEPPPTSGFGITLASFPGLPKLPTLPSLPKLRPLKGSPEETIATAVYGSSIDTSVVSLSDKTGIGGRAFVIGLPNPIGRSRQVMNVGTSPSRDRMVHELAHVWQSQHSSSAVKFMANAVESQALEAAANRLSGSKSFSAYGYRPGKPFGEYAAEQIAQQAMRGEAAILAHMKGIAAWAADADNETSLGTPRIEDTSLPGVKS